MSYVLEHMFDPVPTERSGMNSTRMAELLNFRKNLPRIVTVAHVHALIDRSPTQVEKETAQLLAAGLLRKVTVPGRGAGTSSISDVLLLTKDWVAKVEQARGLEPGIKGK